MKDVFRGRTAELNILNKKYRQEGFIMTVLYGRRRVGKTRLIVHGVRHRKQSVNMFMFCS